MWSARPVIIVFALLTTGCSVKAMSPPQIVVDRTACSHCGMFVSEPIYAAAFQARGDDPRVFDDIACMLKALRSETATPIGVWVQDAGGGGWLDAAAATFVASPKARTPMGGGLLAYADAARAQSAAAAQEGAAVRSFDALLNQEGVER